MSEGEQQQAVEDISSAGGDGTARAVATSRVYEHIGFERTVLNGLVQTGIKGDWRVLTSPASSFDAQIEIEGQARPLYVEARLTIRPTELRKLVARLKGLDGDVIVFVRDDVDVRRLRDNPPPEDFTRVLGSRRILILAWEQSFAAFAVELATTGGSSSRDSLNILTDFVLLTGAP